MALGAVEGLQPIAGAPGGGVAPRTGGRGMLSFPGSLRVFVALESCDMRKGFEGLAGLVHTALREDLKSGALFVFGNRRRTRLKLLYWDGSGLWVMTKRLEKGTFSWPKDTEGKRKLVLRPEALAMLTDGVDLRGAKLRPWYERGE
jgi:transposase